MNYGESTVSSMILEVVYVMDVVVCCFTEIISISEVAGAMSSNDLLQ